ncbi:MAG: exonuclease VII small subunit, partial [Gammaproteobacteria bacterium]|nr:exonuclease VII small subunit [Gammaproteobacteria bacterium]
IINFEEYFKLEGSEEFNGILTINNKLVSLELESNLSNTKITSIIDDLEKESIQELKTTIKIKDLSNPTYFIYNKNFKSYIGSKNNGYFSLGNQFDQQIESRNFEDGFYLFLSLQKLDISNISLNNEINGVSNLKSINLDVKELNFFENLYKNQKFEIDFENNNINAAFSGKDLNGMIATDKTGFIKIEVFDTKFEFQGINIIESGGSNDLTDINLRFIGRNIKTYDDTFQDVDFYLLRNKRITTIDNIKIKSKNFNIGPTSKNEKAYISYNKTRDLYKVRGSYEINNKDNSLNNFTNYNLGYISTDLNIQWIGLQELKDIQGNIKFLIKDFESKNSLPDSAFLRALKVFNLNAIIENISNETNIGNKNLVINRAEGDFYISQNRALINKPIKLQTSEANMRWTGEVLKNSDGILDKLNLDLEMRLRVSENIPWYAAIFGGVPALAGGIVLENIFEDSLDSVSTFNFKVKGTVEEPLIERLD